MTANSTVNSVIPHCDTRLPITSKKEEIIILISIAVTRIEAKIKILRLVSLREGRIRFEILEKLSTNSREKTVDVIFLTF